jgi:DoxX-like family
LFADERKEEAMANMTGDNRVRQLAGSVLIFLPGLALAMSSIVKFAGVPKVVHQMALAGFTDGRLLLVAILEILSAMLFLYPKTRSFGLLLISSFLGGAICTHVQIGEFPKAVGPAILLTLAWTGTWLRHPETLWSFRTDVSAQGIRAENGEARLASREA